MGPTTDLRRELKARFLPYAADRGFVVDRTAQPQSTVFRRRVGHDVQIFEVQWEKYGRPRFRVNFGTCPADGLRAGGTVHPPDATLPSWCPDAGTLQPRRGRTSRSWFRQDATWAERLLGKPARRDPSAVVDECLSLFQELERYWTHRQVGPHLRQWDLSPRPDR